MIVNRGAFRLNPQLLELLAECARIATQNKPLLVLRQFRPAACTIVEITDRIGSHLGPIRIRPFVKGILTESNGRETRGMSQT